MAVPSSEQQQIIDAVLGGANVAVNAVAGSGKTTTILFLARAAPHKKILLLTYNARLKAETRRRVKDWGLANVTVHSYHSFGYACIGEKFATDAGVNEFLVEPRRFSCPQFDIVAIDETQDMTPKYYEFLHYIFAAAARGPQQGTLGPRWGTPGPQRGTPGPQRGTPGPQRGTPLQTIVIGDAAQCIYEFLGADDRFMIKAEEIMKPELLAGPVAPRWETKHLNQTYRLTRPMAAFMNDFLLDGAGRFVSERDGPRPIYQFWNPFRTDIAAGLIRQCLAEGYPPEHIFILVPSIQPAAATAKKKRPIHLLENMLSDLGIPVFVPLSDDTVLNSKCIKGKIVISTIHQAKGLERPVVMVLDFDESYFTYYGKNLPRDRCPNTLYVAASRGRDRLIVLHNSKCKPLPFIDTAGASFRDRVAQFCEVRGVAETGAAAEPQMPRRYEITKLVRHLPENAIGDAMSRLTWKGHGRGRPIATTIRSKQFCAGRKTTEDVSAINGIAIAFGIELMIKGAQNTAVWKWLEQEGHVEAVPSERLDEKTIDPRRASTDGAAAGRNISGPQQGTLGPQRGTPGADRSAPAGPDPAALAETFRRFLETSSSLPEIEDVLRLSAFYASKSSNYNSCFNQIFAYDWMSEHVFDLLCSRAVEIISLFQAANGEDEAKNWIFEKLSTALHRATQSQHGAVRPAAGPQDGAAGPQDGAAGPQALRAAGHEAQAQAAGREAQVVGRFDVIAGECLWELKTAKSLKPEHYLQLAGYAWLALQNATAVAPGPNKFMLLNVPTGEIVELILETDEQKATLRGVIDDLIAIKMAPTKKVTLPQFIHSAAASVANVMLWRDSVEAGGEAEARSAERREADAGGSDAGGSDSENSGEADGDLLTDRFKFAARLLLGS